MGAAFNTRFTHFLLTALVVHQYGRPDDLGYGFGIGVVIAAGAWAWFCSWREERYETASR